MSKYVILVIASLWMAAVAAHNERYYSLHPIALQKAIKQCPEKHPATVSCEELNTVALRVNQLAYQLRSDPQGYGKKILALQETIAKQEAMLKNDPNRPELRASLDEHKRDLRESLAVVKWLESPES